MGRFEQIRRLRGESRARVAALARVSPAQIRDLEEHDELTAIPDPERRDAVRALYSIMLSEVRAQVLDLERRPGAPLALATLPRVT